MVLRFSHVEEHFSQGPNVLAIFREKDWVDWVGLVRVLEELDGDGHQLFLIVQVEQTNWRDHLRSESALAHVKKGGGVN
jgi:hypothetical protein